jgi:carboxypeptidase C (cathepsin A)
MTVLEANRSLNLCQSNARNEDQLAAQFAGFLFQFLEVFSELKGKNFYATGESYAGAYIPCMLRVL